MLLSLACSPLRAADPSAPKAVSCSYPSRRGGEHERHRVNVCSFLLLFFFFFLSSPQYSLIDPFDGRHGVGSFCFATKLPPSGINNAPPVICVCVCVYVENAITGRTVMSLMRSSAQQDWTLDGCSPLSRFPPIYILSSIDMMVMMMMMIIIIIVAVLPLFLRCDHLTMSLLPLCSHQDSQLQFRKRTMEGYQQASSYACPCCIMPYGHLASIAHMKGELFRIAQVLGLHKVLGTGMIYKSTLHKRVRAAIAPLFPISWARLDVLSPHRPNRPHSAAHGVIRMPAQPRQAGELELKGRVQKSGNREHCQKYARPRRVAAFAGIQHPSLGSRERERERERGRPIREVIA